MVWVPVALGRDVPPGATRAVIVDGRELVIWRGEGGAARLWEDRCPHRGMRLSLGFVRGDTLNCLYHGWQYGQDAGCRRIPAHPDLVVPATIRASALASSESGGFVWFGAEGPEPPVLEPAAPVASVAVEADIGTIRGLLDATPRAGLQLLDATIGGVPMCLGWHTPAPGRTLLHATRAIAADPAACLAALRELRGRAERRQAA